MTKGRGSAQGTEDMGQGCRLGSQHRGPPCGLQPYCPRHPVSLACWPAPEETKGCCQS